MTLAGPESYVVATAMMDRVLSASVYDVARPLEVSSRLVTLTTQEDPWDRNDQRGYPKT
jgi:hypothetical protein